MGKGVIMELRNRKAVVLTPDGEFKNIRLAKDHHHAVGQEIRLDAVIAGKRDFSPFKNIRTIPAFSYGAAFIVFCLILTNFFFFQSPNHAVAAYVSFDINPSIEVSVDEDLNVIKVLAMNEDAKVLVPNIEDYYGKNIDEFANDFFEKVKASGYLKEYDEILVVTTVKDDSTESDLQEDIEQSINEAKEATISEDEVEVVVQATTVEKHEEAKENGFSTGKYITYLDAKNSGSDITMDEAKKMPLEQLRAKAHPGKGKAKGKDKNAQEKNNKDKNNNGKAGQDHPSKDNPSNDKNMKDKNKDKNDRSNENNGKNNKNEHDDKSAHSNSNSKEDKHSDKKNGKTNGKQNRDKDPDNQWKDKNNKGKNKQDKRETSAFDPLDRYTQYYFLLKRDQN